ncbi:unnamed protein product [Amoebophrya sp. A120]|nr:unnamed protein product [Amoebophrya sp. A120]|eukprot:GSA120T00012068001.1
MASASATLSVVPSKSGRKTIKAPTALPHGNNHASTTSKLTPKSASPPSAAPLDARQRMQEAQTKRMANWMDQILAKPVAEKTQDQERQQQLHSSGGSTTSVRSGKSAERSKPFVPTSAAQQGDATTSRRANTPAGAAAVPENNRPRKQVPMKDFAIVPDPRTMKRPPPPGMKNGNQVQHQAVVNNHNRAAAGNSRNKGPSIPEEGELKLSTEDLIPKELLLERENFFSQKKPNDFDTLSTRTIEIYPHAMQANAEKRPGEINVDHVEDLGMTMDVVSSSPALTPAARTATPVNKDPLEVEFEKSGFQIPPTTTAMDTTSNVAVLGGQEGATRRSAGPSLQQQPIVPPTNFQLQISPPTQFALESGGTLGRIPSARGYESSDGEGRAVAAGSGGHKQDASHQPQRFSNYFKRTKNPPTTAAALDATVTVLPTSTGAAGASAAAGPAAPFFGAGSLLSGTINVLPPGGFFGPPASSSAGVSESTPRAGLQQAQPQQQLLRGPHNYPSSSSTNPNPPPSNLMATVGRAGDSRFPLGNGQPSGFGAFKVGTGTTLGGGLVGKFNLSSSLSGSSASGSGLLQPGGDRPAIGSASAGLNNYTLNHQVQVDTLGATVSVVPPAGPLVTPSAIISGHVPDLKMFISQQPKPPPGAPVEKQPQAQGQSMKPRSPPRVPPTTETMRNTSSRVDVGPSGRLVVDHMQQTIGSQASSQQHIVHADTYFSFESPVSRTAGSPLLEEPREQFFPPTRPASIGQYNHQATITTSAKTTAPDLVLHGDEIIPPDFLHAGAPRDRQDATSYDPFASVYGIEKNPEIRTISASGNKNTMNTTGGGEMKSSGFSTSPAAAAHEGDRGGAAASYEAAQLHGGSSPGQQSSIGGSSSTSRAPPPIGYFGAQGPAYVRTERQLALTVQLDENVWDTVRFTESDDFEQCGADFLRRNKKNLIFCDGLVAEMRQLAASGEDSGNCDIANLL